MGWVASSETMRETHTHRHRKRAPSFEAVIAGDGVVLLDAGEVLLLQMVPVANPQCLMPPEMTRTHTLSLSLTHTQCTRITELTACSTGEGKGGAYQVGAYEVGWRLEQVGLERMGVPLEELLLLVLA
jgi:hypothetical protein